jgi:tetratricopeptide (TPR) repeat protein
MTLRKTIIAFLSVAFVFGFSPPADAQSPRDKNWRECQGFDGVTPAQGIAACDRIIRSGNENATGLSAAYNNRGNRNFDRKEHDLALADYNESLRLNPRNSKTYTNRGTYWEHIKDYDRAIADHSEAIRLDANNQDAWYNRGVVYRIKGQRDLAIADFRQALHLNPNDTDAIKNLEFLGVKP